MQPWPYDNFHLIVREVIRSTPTSDAGVRDTVLGVCADAVEEITGVAVKNGIAPADWAPILKEDPDFLLEVLQRAASNNVRTATELKQTHAKEKQTLNNQSDVWESKYLDSREEMGTYEAAGLKKMLDKAKLLECPNYYCSRSFQPIFEEAGTTSSSEPIVLKCRKCTRKVRY